MAPLEGHVFPGEGLTGAGRAVTLEVIAKKTLPFPRADVTRVGGATLGLPKPQNLTCDCSPNLNSSSLHISRSGSPG